MHRGWKAARWPIRRIIAKQTLRHSPEEEKMGSCHIRPTSDGRIVIKTLLE